MVIECVNDAVKVWQDLVNHRTRNAPRPQGKLPCKQRAPRSNSENLTDTDCETHQLTVFPPHVVKNAV